MKELLKSLFTKNLATTIPVVLTFIARALKTVGIIDIPENVINAMVEVALYFVGLFSASTVTHALLQYRSSKVKN